MIFFEINNLSEDILEYGGLTTKNYLIDIDFEN